VAWPCWTCPLARCTPNVKLTTPHAPLQTALAEAGIEAGGQLVDRDRVLTALTKAWGKKAWAACDTK